VSAYGLAIVIGALLALLGASLGFGGGSVIGFAMLVVALVLLGVGTAGRAVTEPSMSGVLVALAMLVAACSIGLAVIALATPVRSPLSDVAGILLRPVFVVLIVAVVAFAGAGLVSGQLPRVPSLGVALGACLLAAGLAEQERIADVGFWLSMAGWVVLGVLDWGDPGTSPVDAS
jgi:hypothetical protein